MMYFVTVLLIVVGVAGIAFTVATLIGLLNRNPYVGSEPEKITAMIKLAEVKPDERAVDIGSGDGRIVVALAHEGVAAHGYEISLLLVLWSYLTAWRNRVLPKTRFYWKSYWQADFSHYTLVTLYGLPFVMEHLEPKLKKELPKGARIVSNSFRFVDWPVAKERDGTYLYIQS